MHAQSLSHVWLLAAPWTVTHQAPLSMRFSRQEYWTGLIFPTQGSNSCLVHVYVSCIGRWIPHHCATWEAQFPNYEVATDGDCSHEIKRRLLLRRKAMTNLELSLGPEYVFLAGKLYKPNSQAVPSVLLLRVAAGVEKGVSASAQ